MEESDVETIQKVRISEPKKYKVLIHNDDYTTMEFVIYILKSIFHKNEQEAEGIMLKVHHHGLGVCGIYTKEIAESKVEKVNRESKDNGFPLLASMEVED